MDIQRTFHLHMISDSTGETLITIAKAVRVQYGQVRAIEHLHPLVRSRRELERVVRDVEAAPGSCSIRCSIASLPMSSRARARG